MCFYLNKTLVLQCVYAQMRKGACVCAFLTLHAYMGGPSEIISYSVPFLVREASFHYTWAGF